jgi:ketohexokinase
MARVLGIGTATLDIINEVDGYPTEDSEVRATAQRSRCGGNAVNTLKVLRLLGHQCEFGGVLTNDPNGVLIREELEHRGIGIAASRLCSRGKTPTSYICLNRRNGSRTIVHYRDLPEYRYEDFSALDLSGYDWLHFEGRQVDDTRAMLHRIRNERSDLRVSLEIEKPRSGIEILFEGPQLLLFSRVYMEARGYVDPLVFIHEMSKKIPDVELVCALGSEGAIAAGRNGKVVFSPAYAPRRVIDSLGAGDAFNAAIIDARLCGMELSQALHAANRLAGKKCGLVGFDGLSG